MNSLMIPMDYPDPDVIRVNDTYYMVSTTMHFMPGCVILHSYNLSDWEIVSYVYEELEPGEKQCLDGAHAYGLGMWAASLRYHEGTFYVCFVANDTGKTYLFRASDVKGPWKRSEIEGFYHDSSLLFDDDGKVYIVYGNRQIYITELNEELSAPKEGGLHRLIIEDKDDVRLGYEGAHFYKINGKYYIFLIHWGSRPGAMRSQACFVADQVEGPYVGKTVIDDDGGYCGQGVAQGGIVSTPDHRWYGVFFRDSGAVGRMPVLVPMVWEDDFPVFGADGKVPEHVLTTDLRPGYVYAPLYGDESFDGELSSFWQWNHIPQKDLWFVDKKKKALQLTCGKLCDNPVQAVNMLTQRFVYPGSDFEVHIDGTEMKDGDVAGLCLLQGDYKMLALEKRDGQFFVTLISRGEPTENGMYQPYDVSIPEQKECFVLESAAVTMRVCTDFTNMKDKAQFYIKQNQQWQPVGEECELFFKLDHFCGVRAGLCYYGTKELGGVAQFSAVKHIRREH